MKLLRRGPIQSLSDRLKAVKAAEDAKKGEWLYETYQVPSAAKIAKLQQEGWEVWTVLPAIVGGTSWGTNYVMRKRNPHWHG